MQRQPRRPITREEISTYEQDGVVCLRQLFDPEWLEFMREVADNAPLHPTRFGSNIAANKNEDGTFFYDTYMWLEDEASRRYVFESPAAEIGARLMGSPKVSIFFDHCLLKEPRTNTVSPWHQDLSYMPIEGSQICALWMALDPCSRENGAVEFVRGSHRWGRSFRPTAWTNNTGYTASPFPPVPDIEANRSSYDIIDFVMDAGDCVVFHGLLLHGAKGNKSDWRRRAWVTRWAGVDVVYAPRPGIMDMPEVPDIPPGGPIECDLWPQVWPPGGERRP